MLGILQLNPKSHESLSFDDQEHIARTIHQSSRNGELLYWRFLLLFSGLRLEQFLTAKLECFDDTWICECGDVSEIGFVASNLPQNASHDLSGTSFGQIRGLLFNKNIREKLKIWSREFHQHFTNSFLSNNTNTKLFVQKRKNYTVFYFCT